MNLGDKTVIRAKSYKSFCSIFLAAVLIITSAASVPLSAQEQGEKNLVRQAGEKYARSSRHLSPTRLKRVLGGSKGMAQKTSNFAGHQFQTIILISILSAAEIYKEKLRLKKIKNEDYNFYRNLAEVPELALEAASELVDSGEFWSSVLGASTARVFLGAPTNAIIAILQNATSKKLLKDLIASGLNTYVTFVGWEFGGQLFKEATMLLEEDADYELAQNFGSLLIKTVRAKATAQERSVISAVLLNMARILFTDLDLLQMLTWNTWRERIATGHFATLVTAMATASTAGSAVGTALFPGAGTVAGWLIGGASGLVGGAIAMFAVPKEYQDKMTLGMRKARRSLWALGSDNGGFMNPQETALSILYDCASKGEPCPPMLKFPVNPRPLEAQVSMIFESLHHYEGRLEMAKASMALAQSKQNLASYEEYLDVAKTTSAEYEEALKDLEAVYTNEIDRLNKLFNKFPIEPSWAVQNEELQMFFLYFEKTKMVADLMKVFTKTVRSQMNDETKDYSFLLYKLYSVGFTELEFKDAFTVE